MKPANIVRGVAFVLAGLMMLPAAAQEGRGDVVYVPTPQISVDTMLQMAKIGPKDFLIDLGSGDGRIVITAASKFGASGFGVDLDTYLLKLANQNAKKAGVTDKVRFVEENLFETDLSRATVISTYLLPEMNLKLRPKLMSLKPGTRIVTHDYHLGEWDPDEQRELIVPEKKVGEPGISYVFSYVVPARVPGKWQSLVNIGGRETPLEFNLIQEFQEVDGKVEIRDRSADLRGRIMGENIRMVAGGRNGVARHEFSGRIDGDTIKGTLVVGEGAARQQTAWVARLTQRGELKRASDELPEEK
ncbi:MAG: methyltransferase domain-containing protein [Betaproteobacteria bacterium]|nr:methyltransferase domain-containing protein [Betaproteobacteria bacterium]